MKRCLLLGFFFLPLVSCNKEVSMDVAYLEGKPVVNAYIAADAPMRVWLSKTRSPMSNQDVAFDDATVIVSEGESDDTLAFDGSSYFSDKVAKAGHEYALKIYSDDTLCAFSYDIIPTDVTDYQVTGFVDSAGDLPVLKYEQEFNQLVEYRSDGILLGFSEDTSFSDLQITLEANEEIYIVSDGMIDFQVNEEKKSDMEMFKNKLLDLKSKLEPTEHIVSNLFNKHTSQVDDCNIIKKQVQN